MARSGRGILVAFLACLVVLVLWRQRKESLEVAPAISNGRIAAVGRYPFIGHTFCSGGPATCFLIDPYHVMTAGHVAQCFRFGLEGGSQKGTPKVYLGGRLFDNSDAKEVHEVVGIDMPPKGTFNPVAKFETDWGIMTLKNPSKLTPVLVDGLNADVTVKVGDWVWHAGYGALSVKPNPKEGEAPIYTWPVYLQENKAKVAKVSDNLIELFTNEKQDGFPTPYRQACVGDSGSPVLVIKDGRWVAVGIVTQGPGKYGGCATTPEEASYQRGVARRIKPLWEARKKTWTTKQLATALSNCDLKPQLAGGKCPKTHPWHAGVWDQGVNTPAGFAGKQCSNDPWCALKLNRLYVAGGAQSRPVRWASA